MSAAEEWGQKVSHLIQEAERSGRQWDVRHEHGVREVAPVDGWQRFEWDGSQTITVQVREPQAARSP